MPILPRFFLNKLMWNFGQWKVERAEARDALGSFIIDGCRISRGLWHDSVYTSTAFHCSNLLLLSPGHERCRWNISILIHMDIRSIININCQDAMRKWFGSLLNLSSHRGTDVVSLFPVLLGPSDIHECKKIWTVIIYYSDLCHTPKNKLSNFVLLHSYERRKVFGASINFTKL